MGEIGETLAPKNLEINALRRVKEVVTYHGRELEDAYRRKSRTKIYEIVRSAGFEPKEVRIGTIFINTKGEKDMVTRYNPARMGQGNTLLVAVEGNKLVSFEELAHDVGAILLGEMRPHPEWSSTITIPHFNQIAQTSIGRSYSEQELATMRMLIHDKERGSLVAATRVLDAIVFGKLPFRAIKYA